MGTVTRVIAMRLGGMLVVWLVAALIPGELLAGEAAHTSPGTQRLPPTWSSRSRRACSRCGRRTPPSKRSSMRSGGNCISTWWRASPPKNGLPSPLTSSPSWKRSSAFVPMSTISRSRMPRRHQALSGNSSSSRSVRQACHRARSRRTAKHYYHPSLGRAQPRPQEPLNVPSHLPLSLIPSAVGERAR